MDSIMDHEEIARLTLEYGGNWGIQHSRRLLHLCEMLGEGIPYDDEVIWLAAHMHDWGGYAPWLIPGVEHQIRSRQVAEEFLAVRACPQALAEAVLECIECHHGGPRDRRLESILFTDADAVDLLGVVGALRIFAMNPRDIRAGWQATQAWRDKSIAALGLEKSRQFAAQRIDETNRLLQDFERETFGMF